MIIATGSVNIDENTKLAEQAGADNEEALKDLKTSMDGKITVSTQAPFNDGADHADGDLWLIQSDGLTTAMYSYGTGGWAEKQWDQDTLNVKELSALTSNLGTVNAGTINGVTINGASINSSSLYVDGMLDQFWMDKNGFHVKNRAGGFSTWIYGGMITLNSGSASVSMDTRDGFVSTMGGTFNGISVSGHTIACEDSGALYLESNGGNGNLTDVHGGDIYAHGIKLKSALSAKRDIDDYSGSEALAAIMNTDVKKWRYIESDNSSNSQHIGPVIDDVNAIGDKETSVAADMVSTDEKGDYYLNESNTISILMAALKESKKKIDELSLRVTQLERGKN